MRVANEDLLMVNGVRAPVSLATSATLRPLYLGHIVNYAIQLVFTGTPNGSFKLQYSNDVPTLVEPVQSLQYTGVVNWTDVENSMFLVSEAGDIMWEVQNSGAEWVRVVYTSSSGTGSLIIARAKVKGV